MIPKSSQGVESDHKMTLRETPELPRVPPETSPRCRGGPRALQCFANVIQGCQKGDRGRSPGLPGPSKTKLSRTRELAPARPVKGQGCLQGTSELILEPVLVQFVANRSKLTLGRRPHRRLHLPKSRKSSNDFLKSSKHCRTSERKKQEHARRP